MQNNLIPVLPIARLLGEREPSSNLLKLRRVYNTGLAPPWKDLTATGL